MKTFFKKSLVLSLLIPMSMQPVVAFSGKPVYDSASSIASATKDSVVYCSAAIASSLKNATLMSKDAIKNVITSGTQKTYSGLSCLVNRVTTTARYANSTAWTRLGTVAVAALVATVVYKKFATKTTPKRIKKIA